MAQRLSNWGQELIHRNPETYNIYIYIHNHVYSCCRPTVMLHKVPGKKRHPHPPLNPTLRMGMVRVKRAPKGPLNKGPLVLRRIELMLVTGMKALNWQNLIGKLTHKIIIIINYSTSGDEDQVWPRFLVHQHEMATVGSRQSDWCRHQAEFQRTTCMTLSQNGLYAIPKCPQGHKVSGLFGRHIHFFFWFTWQIQ